MIYKALIKEAEVGKKVGGCLYIHQSASYTLPPTLGRHLESAACAARTILADRDHERKNFSCNVVKFSYTGAVSFLVYQDFHSDEHPALSVAITLSADQKEVTVREYKKNRPILHRKETMLSPCHSLFKYYKGLTEAEEAAGLLKNPPGYKAQWEALLKEKGARIEGHRLFLD